MSENELGRAYVGLAIYSGEEEGARISSQLKINSTSFRIRDGRSVWLFSTKDAFSGDSVEGHISHLMHVFDAAAGDLMALSKSGFEFRVWVYFEVGAANRSFVLSQEFILWLSSMGADICVDAWSGIAEDGER